MTCRILLLDPRAYGANKRIVSIEGLEFADGELRPVQQAVVDEQGIQCAFCMSGFVMAAVWIPEEESDPTRERLTWNFRQPLPLRRLRQDPERVNARRRYMRRT